MISKIFEIVSLGTLIMLFSCGKDSTKPQPKTINLTLDRSSLNFGNVFVGQSRDTSFTITNEAGSADGLVGKAVISGEGFSLQADQDFNLSPGEEKSFSVRYTPVSAGQNTGTISLIHNATNAESPLFIQLSGNANLSVNIHISNDTLDFGLVEQGQFKDDSLYIRNDTDSGGELSGSVTLTGANFQILQGGGNFSLLPGDSTRIVVRLQADASEAYAGLLTIQHNANQQATPIVVPLAGQIDKTPEIENRLQNGWNYFENQSYQNAKNEFDAALLISILSPHYLPLRSEAQSGKGWSDAYLHNFGAAELEFTASLNIPESATETEMNSRAGLAIVYHVLDEYENAVAAAAPLLTAAPSYYFTHDSTVYFRKIRLIAVQSYYSLGDFINSSRQLDILDPDNSPHATDPETLLRQIQEVASNI